MVEDVKLSDIYVEHNGGGTAEQAKMEVPEKEAMYPEPNMLAMPLANSTASTGADPLTKAITPCRRQRR